MCIQLTVHSIGYWERTGFASFRFHSLCSIHLPVNYCGKYRNIVSIRVLMRLVFFAFPLRCHLCAFLCVNSGHLKKRKNSKQTDKQKIEGRKTLRS